MKKLLILFFTFLSLTCEAKDKENYMYQKTSISYNPRLNIFDSSKQIFYLIKSERNIYFKNIINEFSQDSSFVHLGKFYLNKSHEFVWNFNKQVVKIFSLTDTVVTSYDGNSKFIFLKGRVYNDNVDTIINGYNCAKFVRNFKGNPGRDIPNYIAEEYVDIKKQIIVFQKIKYSHPYKVILINLLRGN